MQRADRTSNEGHPPSQHGSSQRGRVLLVDDNIGVLDFFGFSLRRSGFEVATATSAATALAAARTGFDVMLLDVRLGQDDGLDVLRAIRKEGIDGEVIVITGFDVDGIEEEAHRLRAEFVDRWTLPDPVELVQRSLGKAPHQTERNQWNTVITPPALARWADAVARGATAADDPRTLSAWARGIFMSPASLRALCALAGISPRDSCTLVRILRAVHLADRSGRMDVSEWLDVADERTLERLLAVAGVQRGGPVSMEQVLGAQRLIVNETAIALLSRALRARGLLANKV